MVKIIFSTLLYEKKTKYFGFFSKILKINNMHKEFEKILIFSRVLTKKWKKCYEFYLKNGTKSFLRHYYMKERLNILDFSQKY